MSDIFPFDSYTAVYAHAKTHGTLPIAGVTGFTFDVANGSLRITFVNPRKIKAWIRREEVSAEPGLRQVCRYYDKFDKLIMLELIPEGT